MFTFMLFFNFFLVFLFSCLLFTFYVFFYTFFLCFNPGGLQGWLDAWPSPGRRQGTFCLIYNDDIIGWHNFYQSVASSPMIDINANDGRHYHYQGWGEKEDINMLRLQHWPRYFCISMYFVSWYSGVFLGPTCSVYSTGPGTFVFWYFFCILVFCCVFKPNMLRLQHWSR